MAAIGSLVFCTDCGNLLPASKGSSKNILQCECCGAENQGECFGIRDNDKAKFASANMAYRHCFKHHCNKIQTF